MFDTEKEVTKTVTEIVKVKVPTRANFKEFIAFQHPSGQWIASDECEKMLEFFIADGTCSKFAGSLRLIQMITAHKIKPSICIKDILTTLIALYILHESFENRAEEWSLIEKKAKAWLVAAGLKNIDMCVSTICFKVK